MRELLRAEKILANSSNWNNKNNCSYNQETLKRAILFIKNHALYLYKNFNLTLNTPDIESGPKKSIDIHWQTPNYELLVNIPNNPLKPNTYYGDNYNNFTIKGSFNSTEIEHELFTLLYSHWKEGNTMIELSLTERECKLLIGAIHTKLSILNEENNIEERIAELEEIESTLDAKLIAAGMSPLL